jgi:hypothetical protein
MDLLMNISAYNLRDLQNLKSLLTAAMREKMTVERLMSFVEKTISEAVAEQQKGEQKGLPTGSVCSECGGPAIKTPVNTTPGNQVDGPWTHAVQCQNRPAKDNPWLPKHCGHTDYLVERR